MPLDDAGALLVLAVTGVAEVRPGDDLGRLLAEALTPPAAPVPAAPVPAAPVPAAPPEPAPPPRVAATPPLLHDGDVVVVTQKVVSKAEGRVVPVDHHDPEAKMALVEREAVRILRRRGDLVITETRHGFVCANAGVDLSNMEDGTAALLPVDPDRSARRIRAELRRRLGVSVGVVVSDTFGRPWRQGVTDVAIGCAGLAGVVDLRGTPDATGRTLSATVVCVADEVAAAAELVMGKDRAVPAAVVRGVPPNWLRDGSVAADIVRPPAEDLFR